MPERAFLLPGESTFRRDGAVVGTLLGSCVAVCLFDPRHEWGGMNHFMLPVRDGDLAPGKYGDYSTEALIEVALRAGSGKADLAASLYGGGRVVGRIDESEASGDIGARNIASARQVLARHRIRIVAQDVGGNLGRKIYMNTATNEVRVRRIERIENAVASQRRRDDLRTRPVRVLIVDDSATVRRILRRGVELAGGMEVVGEAADPYEARERILDIEPDVLCLDLIMPRMDGLTFLRKIMQYKPIPTVVVSTIVQRGGEMRAKVLQAGAIEVIDKEELSLYRDTGALQRVLVPALRSAAERVVRKTPV